MTDRKTIIGTRLREITFKKEFQIQNTKYFSKIILNNSFSFSKSILNNSFSFRKSIKYINKYIKYKMHFEKYLK